MFVVTLSGSPNPASRTAHLLSHARTHLQQQKIQTQAYTLADFDAYALLHQQSQQPSYERFKNDVANADGLIIATPIYKASFSGLLKSILDLLPQNAFANKPTLPLASAGSSSHLLALDYALKPVLAALKAYPISEGLIALDSHAELGLDGSVTFTPDLNQRLESALNQFSQLLLANKRQSSPFTLAHSYA